MNKERAIEILEGEKESVEGAIELADKIARSSVEVSDGLRELAEAYDIAIESIRLLGELMKDIEPDPVDYATVEQIVMSQPEYQQKFEEDNK